MLQRHKMQDTRHKTLVDWLLYNWDKIRYAPTGHENASRGPFRPRDTVGNMICFWKRITSDGP